MMMSWQHLMKSTLVLLLLNAVAISRAAEADTTATTLKPTIRNTANAARVFTEGEDALMTCVVTDLGQYTVMWSRLDHNKKTILTIRNMKITTDKRIQVLHDTGGDVWVLVIKQVAATDAGVYVCEVNSNPSLTSHYMVTIQPRNENVTSVSSELRSAHNYTDCCQQNGVSQQCLGFCTIHNILEGSAGIEPEACENHFPNIVGCMADHRNHVDCCEREEIPDICQDLCRGEYTLQKDSIQSHFSCTAYTERTLMCISEGIEVLPRPPESPSITVMGPTSILVKWEHPTKGSPPPESYMVNITTIRRFDPPVDVTIDSPEYTEDSEMDVTDDLHYIPKKRQVKVPASQTQVNITALSPLTWYEISVISVNRHGSSLAPYNLRALTNYPDTANKSEVIHSELPDIIGCCRDRGVKHFRCLNNLCNPETKYIAEPDMIVCAPWATEAFSCLANDFDHTDCCRERGLPPVCVELCSGNVTKIDYNYFRCVDYFSDYRSCLMKGYGVLPGSPSTVAVTNIHPTYVLLTWMPPLVLGESVTAYHAYFRPVSADRGCEGTWFMEGVEISYRGLYTESAPYVLEHLCPNSEYEVYVQAVNKHGSGDPSPRVLFRTPSVQKEQKLQKHTYNVTECCRSVNISPGCMPLCDYNARMTHVRMLLDRCTQELPQLLRCGVGGRDHTPCCSRRGVPQSCMSLCSGSFNNKQDAPHQCLPFIGNVMMCLEEGVGVLPGPVVDLHATEVRDGGVTLVWQPPQPMGANISHYQLHYEEVSANSASHTVFSLNNTIDYNITVSILNNLTIGALYNFFVITNNTAGTSLPSSILTINLTAEAHGSAAMAGTSSAPHSLELQAKSSTSLTFAWAPPKLAHPYDRFRYYFYFRALGSDSEEFNKTITGATALRIDGLSPNTQHICYATAVNDMGESRPSETLLAWTDPAYPAFVETPTVHPINLIVEGGHMTVLCIAMGAPSPTVSLYISGVLIHQNITRHMVTLVNNVTRDMTEISCYADNGYGTPMQSTRTITIHRRPLITASETVQAIAGRSVTLECHINAWPHPSMVWWRDPEGRVPVIHGGNYIIEQKETGQGEGNYVLSLNIKNVTENIDNDHYYCHAQNSFGQMTKTIDVDMLKAVQVEYDVTECCLASNMSSSCIDACAFDQIDFDRVMNRDDCIPDFGKLMKCAADGSDHRSCCDNKGVPKQCLDWCRGQVVPHHHECQLQWAPVIISCFSEGQEALPGPPLNLRMSSVADNSAIVSWDIPMKNPETVLLYRVFWRQVGQSIANKNDTSFTQLLLTSLNEGVKYEVAVKAGNNKGTSILTNSITYMHTSGSVSNTPTVVSYQSDVAVAVGSVFVVVILCVILIVAFWWARKNKIICDKASTNGGISFENPSYIKEQNGDTVQIAETPNGSLNGTVTSGMNGNINGGIPNGGFSHGNMNGGHNGGLNNGINNVWNSQQPSSAVPGFEDDLPSKGGYKRFNS